MEDTTYLIDDYHYQYHRTYYRQTSGFNDNDNMNNENNKK